MSATPAAGSSARESTSLRSPLGTGERRIDAQSSPQPLSSSLGGENEPSGAGGTGNGGGGSSSSSFVALSFPSSSSSTSSSPASHYPATLSPLTDESSPYGAVARTCLALTQYASSACSSVSYSTAAMTTGEGGCSSASAGASSVLIHEETFCREVSDALGALRSCVSEHTNRKCRMAALKCLAILARSAFARLRFDPQLLSTARAPSNSSVARVEDECAADTPTTLAECALNDADDAVAASAVESLGLLCLDSQLDGLTAEVNEIAFASPPRRWDHGDEDDDGDEFWGDEAHSAILELQQRVASNVLPPRLRRLVHRVSLLRPSSLRARCLPLLTWALCHLRRSAAGAAILPGVVPAERYSKRWYEVDVGAALVDELVGAVLMPDMMDSVDGRLATCAAVASVRLAAAACGLCGGAFWVEGACVAAADVLLQSVRGGACGERVMGGEQTMKGSPGSPPLDAWRRLDMVETRAATLAVTLVAARGIPIASRPELVSDVLEEIVHLPATSFALPSACPSREPTAAAPGLSPRPIRVGLLSECALLFLVDGSPTISEERSVALNCFLSGDEMCSILQQRGSETERGRSARRPLTHVAEEIVTVFSSAAFIVGSRVVDAQPSSSSGARAHVPNVEEWLRCSLSVLTIFASCLNWSSVKGDQNQNEAGAYGIESAGEAFLALLALSLRTVGMLPPESNSNASSSTAFSPLRLPNETVAWARRELMALTEQLLKYKLREGIHSRPVRLRLLSILAHSWVQQRKLLNELSMSHVRQGGQRELNPREILSMLGTDLTSLVGKDSSSQSDLGLLRVAVDCVEAMALFSWEQGQSCVDSSTRSVGLTNEDDAGSMVSLAVDILNRLREEHGPAGEESSSSDMLKHCISAAQRIQSVVESNEPNSLTATSCDLTCIEEHPGPSLATFDQALFWRHAKILVASRINRALWFSPLSSDNVSFGGTLKNLNAIAIPIRERNTLRLSPAGWSNKSLASIRKIKSKSPNESVVCITGSSDPLVATLSYDVKGFQRHDGEDEPRLVVTLRMYNATAVTILNGIRIDLAVTSSDNITARYQQDVSTEVAPVLLTETNDIFQSPPSPCGPLQFASASFKGEVKPSDCLTWEVALEHWSAGSIDLSVSISFREIQVETPRFRWVSGSVRQSGAEKKALEDVSENSEVIDGTVTDTDTSAGASVDEAMEDDDETMDWMLLGDPVHVPVVVMLQPCPIFHFGDMRDHCVLAENERTFNFLWSGMKYKIPTIGVVQRACHDAQKDPFTSSTKKAIFDRSSVILRNDTDGGSTTLNGGAFMSWCGDYILCKLSVSGQELGVPERNPNGFLEFRSSNALLLKSFAGARADRAAFLCNLTNGYWIESSQKGTVSDGNAEERPSSAVGATLFSKNRKAKADAFIVSS